VQNITYNFGNILIFMKKSSKSGKTGEKQGFYL